MKSISTSPLFLSISFLSIFLAFNLCFGEDTVSSDVGTLDFKLERNNDKIGIGVSEVVGTVFEKNPGIKEKFNSAFITVLDDMEILMVPIIFKAAVCPSRISRVQQDSLKKLYRNLQELIISYEILKILEEKNLIRFSKDSSEYVRDKIKDYLLATRKYLINGTPRKELYHSSQRKYQSEAVKDIKNESFSHIIDEKELKDLSSRIMELILNYQISGNKPKKVFSFIGVGAGYLSSLLGKSGASKIFFGAEFPYSELEGNRIAFSEFFGNIQSHFPFLFQSLKEKLSNGDEDIHNIKVTEKDIYAALLNTNTPLRSYLYASAAKRKASIHLNQKKFFTSVFNREVSF